MGRLVQQPPALLRHRRHSPGRSRSSVLPHNHTVCNPADGNTQPPVNPGGFQRASTIEAVIETPRYDLTWFNLAFGRLAVKAYTKGEHVLRFEANLVSRVISDFTV